MKVLVAYDFAEPSGTEIADWIAAELRRAGCRTVLLPAAEVGTVAGYAGVVLGSAIEDGGWRPAARGFTDRYAAALAGVPVWLYSTGPSRDTGYRAKPPPVPHAADALARLGAREHVTFVGALHWDVSGLFGSPAARRAYGYYRDRERIRTWTARIATALRAARHDGRAAGRAAA